MPTNKKAGDKRQAKRILKNINFETAAESHIALVHRKQGGPASGADYKLVVKNLDFSEEFLEKASKVKVEMDIVEYLERFYGIYGENAEVLARALGFTTKRQEKYALEQQEEMLEDREQMIDPERPNYESSEKDWEDYITSRVGSLEIMKSLYEAESIPAALAELDEDEYLMLLTDQEMLEKAFTEVERLKKESEADKAKDASDEDNKETQIKVSKSDGEASASGKSKQKGLEKPMTKEVQDQVEVVAKAQFESLTKAFDEQTVELNKALEVIKAFEQEKKEAILKSRKAQVLDAVKDEEKAEVVFKAVKDADDADFEAVVKALKDIQVAVEKSALFEEQGASAQEDEVVQESAVAKILKAKQSKAK